MNLLPSKPRFLSSFGIKNPLCIPAPIPKSESNIELSSGCSKTLWSHNETPKSQKKMKKKGSEAWGCRKRRPEGCGVAGTPQILGNARGLHEHSGDLWKRQEGTCLGTRLGEKYRTENTPKY